LAVSRLLAPANLKFNWLTDPEKSSITAPPFLLAWGELAAIELIPIHLKACPICVQGFTAWLIARLTKPSLSRATSKILCGHDIKPGDTLLQYNALQHEHITFGILPLLEVA